MSDEDILRIVRCLNLRGYIQTRGYSTTDLVTEIKKVVSYSTIRNVMLEKVKLGDASTNKLCTALGLPMGWFDQDRRGDDAPLELPPVPTFEEEETGLVVVDNVKVNFRAWSDAGDFDIAMQVPKTKIRKFIMELIDGQ